MKSRATLLLSLIAIVPMHWCAPLSAQNMNRQMLVKLLISKSPRWKQVNSLRVEAHGKQLMAESITLPRVGLISRQFLAQFSAARYGLPQSFDSQMINVGSSMLEFIQSVYDPTASAKLAAAEFYRQFASSQERAYQTDLIFQALSYFLSAQRAKRKFEQSSSSLERAEQIHRIALARLKSGAGIRLDYLRAEGLLAAEKLKRLEQENAYLKAKEDLAVLVGGLPSDFEVNNLEWSEWGLPSQPKDWIKNRPDLEAQRFALQASQSLEKAARRESWPKLAIAGEVGSAGVASVLGMGNVALNWTIGVQLSLPLYDGGYVTGKAAEESARALRTEAGLQQQTLEAESQWTSLVRQYAAAVQARAVAKAQVAAVGEELRLASEKFHSGSSSGIELRNAMVANAQALDNESDALFMTEMIRLQFCRLRTDFSDCGVKGSHDG
jgi:outer membrane protein